MSVVVAENIVLLLIQFISSLETNVDSSRILLMDRFHSMAKTKCPFFTIDKYKKEWFPVKYHRVNVFIHPRYVDKACTKHLTNFAAVSTESLTSHRTLSQAKMAPAPSLSEVSNTMTTTKKTLIRKLAASKAKFNRQSLKPTLQAVYALYQIGYLKLGMALDSFLINTIAVWWKMTGAELHETVKNEKLIHNSKGLIRIDCINLLLKDV